MSLGMTLEGVPGGTARPNPTISASDSPNVQIRALQSQLAILAEAGSRDEAKLKAAQELSDNMDVALTNPEYPRFLESALKIFLKVLQDIPNASISEFTNQQTRKLVLEMIQRFPSNDHLRPYLKQILAVMFKLLEFENEENVLVCLRVIIELHKSFRPNFGPEISNFLQFVKSIYRELPNHLNKIFEPKSPIEVKDLNELNVEALLGETFTTTTIHITDSEGGSNTTYSLIPKAVLSLKVG